MLFLWYFIIMFSNPVKTQFIIVLVIEQIFLYYECIMIYLQKCIKRPTIYLVL